MPAFELKLDEPVNDGSESDNNVFYWSRSSSGSFSTRLTPNLGGLGPVLPMNVDLVRIAAAVYAADRSTPRTVGRVNWRSRNLSLTVPVNNPDEWYKVAGDLEQLLDFLSGDSWKLSFVGSSLPPDDPSSVDGVDAGRVVLLSGGADSAVGALKARMLQEKHVLVSHVGASSISPIQKGVAERVRQLIANGSEQYHMQIAFTRRRVQPNGYRLRNEYSTRTRSLLFLALGLAVASVWRVGVWIPENGFASLNPPLGPDQLGSLSTRTTHPWFLTELSRICRAAGAWAEIENPFSGSTKGEMFRWVAQAIGDDTVASEFLSATNSCAYTGRRWLKAKAVSHCGTCFGCLVRRASFAAAGLADSSTYIVDSPLDDVARRQLDTASILPSIRGFVARGLGVGDMAAMRLPDGYPASRARDLCERGASELAFLT